MQPKKSYYIKHLPSNMIPRAVYAQVFDRETGKMLHTTDLQQGKNAYKKSKALAKAWANRSLS